MPLISKEELERLRAGITETAEDAQAKDVDKPKPASRRLRTYMHDPMDKALSGASRRIVDESKQETLKDPNLSPVESQFVTNFGSGVLAGNVPGGYLEEPETIPQKIAAGAGGGTGLMFDMMLANRLGIPSPVAFSAYGAAHPAESIGERLKNAGKFLLLDRALNFLPKAIVGGVGGVAAKRGGEEAGKAAARATIKALENPAIKLPYNQAVFSGLTELEGGSAKDEFWRNLGAAAAFSVPHGTSIPNPRDAVRQETPKFKDGGVADPIDGVPASVPMSRYLKGEISRAEYVVESAKAADKQTGAVTVDAIKEAAKSRKAENAMRVEEGKAKKPMKGSAIYQEARSKSVSPEVSREVSGGLKDFKLSETVSKNRTIQEITDYRPDSAVAKNTIRLGEMSSLVERKMKIDYAKEAREVLDKIGIKDDSKADKLMNRMKDEYDAGNENVEAFMARRGNQIVEEHGAGIKDADIAKAVSGLDALDALYKNYQAERDMISQAYTGKGFEGRGSYLPKIQERVNPLRHPIKRFMQETEPIQSRARTENTATPSRVLSPREKMRTDSDMKYPREYRGARILENYVNDQARRIAKQPVISATKGVTGEIKDSLYKRKQAARDLLREAKKAEGNDPELAESMRQEANKIYNNDIRDAANRTAEAIDGVMQASYNDIRYGGVAARQSAMSGTRAGMATMRASLLYKKAFNFAKYKLNAPFILFRQWTSSFQAHGVAPEVTPWDMMKAFSKTFREGGHEDVLNTFTGNTKSNAAGTMKSDATGDLHKPTIRRRNILERAAIGLDAMSDKPTNKMEEMTNRFAMEIGNIIAEKRGLTGREKNDLLSDMIDNIQSSYDRESVPEIRRDPFLNAMLPAQSYSLTVWNNARFAKTNAMKLRVVAAAAASQLVYQFATSYLKPTEDKEELAMFAVELALNTAAAVVPYSSALTGLGPGEGRSAPAGLLEDVLGNMPQYIAKAMSEDDDEKAAIYYEKAANEFVKNFVPAGGQISRAISADVMHKNGIISDDELPIASVAGWWMVPGGREYLRKISGYSDKKPPTSRRRR